MANYEFRRIMNMFGFIASMLISVALLIAMFVDLANGDTTGVSIPGFELCGIIDCLVLLSNIIAYFLVIVAGFNYARSKRSVWYMVAQVVATMIILTLLILTNVL